MRKPCWQRDAARKEGFGAGQPKDGYFQRHLDSAQRAVTDAQSIVTGAQSTVNQLILAAAGKEEWVRIEGMDCHVVWLRKACRASIQLEELQATSRNELAHGTVSSCGSVEHFGAGVFLAPHTPPINPDSAAVSGQATLTRRETRFMARAAVDAVFDDRSKHKVIVVGQPGTGKTRVLHVT